MPVGVNLIFTLLLWTFFLIIFLSNSKDKVNQWCFISGMIFSLGVLKEYFFFDLVPFLSQNHFSLFSSLWVESIYSTMTAIVYLLAMPSALVFSFYFSDFRFISPKGLSISRWIIIPAIILFALIYHPFEFRQYQLNSFFFWLSISIYNLAIGIWLTVIMARTVLQEKNSIWRKQKRRVATLVLPLLWYWLITIFVIHTLNIQVLFKVWHNNVLLLTVLLGYYLVVAFREGIMGIKLEAAHYKWSSDIKTVQQGTQYINHFLKNEIAKIEWCANNLANKLESETPEEVGIIFRSMDRLKYLIHRTQLYSKDIQLNCSICSLFEIVENCIEDVCKRTRKDILFQNNCEKGISIRCDSFHISEVLNNLLNNAVDAIEKSGTIVIDLDASNRRQYILSIRDNGIGIQKEALSHLFEPYYTSKNDDEHFGLGLFYSYRVMQKHNGSIDVKSEVGVGSVFHLYFSKHNNEMVEIGVK